MKRYSGTLNQANTTIAISLNDDQDLELLLVQGTGNQTVTWTGVGVWLTPSRTAPTLQTIGGKSDLLTFSRTGGVVYGQHGGDAGPAGVAGGTGPAGITWRGQWVNSINYAVNDVVFQTNSSYICVQANGPATSPVTPGTDTTRWAVLATGSVQIVTVGGDATDNFNRATVTNIATQTAPPAPWLYTATISSHLSIAADAPSGTNMLIQDQAGVGRVVYRVESPLSSVNQHAILTVGSYANNGSTDNAVFGVCCRFAAAANTFYTAFASGDKTAGSWTINIQKCVAGTFTVLGSASPPLTAVPKVGDTLKLDVNGTTITAFWNGIQATQVVGDSSIDGTTVGGVRTGIFFNMSGGTLLKASLLSIGPP